MIETTARRQVPIFGGRPLGQRVRLAAGSIRGTLATVIHVLHSTARRPKHSWRRSGIPGNADPFPWPRVSVAAVRSTGA